MDSADAELPDTETAAPGWGTAGNIAFRIIFAYLVLYLVLARWLETDLAMQHEFGFAPGAQVLLNAYEYLWAPVVTWVGHHVLQLKQPLEFAAGGNSDGIFGFVQLFCFAALSLIAALIWSLLDRRTEYQQLYGWLRTALRYALAFNMLCYGMVKVISVQFPFPGLQEMLTPLGDTSRFMVLANFMGTSAVYTFFTGAGEVLAGALLLHRLTATLGALVAFAIMLNVAMLNFSYDWPEKLDALHLLLFSVFVLAIDAGRLLNVFVLNRPAMPATLGELLSSPRARAVKLTAKGVVIAYMLVTAPFMAVNMQDLSSPPSPLRGIYHVEEFTRNGVLVQPLSIDSTRWKTIVLDAADVVSLQTMDEGWRQYRAAYGAKAARIMIFTGPATSSRTDFNVTKRAQGGLVLQGVFKADTLVVKLKRVDETKFELLRSHFSWINGRP